MKASFSLKRIIFIFMFIFFISLVISQIVVKNVYVFPKYEQLQKEIDQKKVFIVNKEIEIQKDYLNRIVTDNSAWDETYNYALGNNLNYFENTWPNSAYLTLNINYIGFYDSDLNLIEDNTYDFTSKKEIDLIYLNGFKTEDFLISSDDIENGIHEKSGFVLTNYGPMMYSSHIITDNEGLEESAGTMVMGILIDNNFVKDVNSNTGFVVEKIDGKSFENVISDKSIFGSNLDIYYLNYYDLNNKSIFSFKMESDEEILGVFSFYSEDNISLFLLVFISLFIIYFIMIFTLIKPVEDLSNHMKKIHKANEYSKINSKNIIISELKNLYTYFNNLIDMAAYNRDLSQKINFELQQKAYYDQLTKILNRRGLNFRFDLIQNNFFNQNKPCSIIMLDIDFYKSYNDLYGHKKGDEVLVNICSIISEVLRNNNNDIFARYGGEEFVIFLHNVDEAQTLHVIERIQELIYNTNIKHKGSKVSDKITISFGYYLFDDLKNKKLEGLMNFADVALYKSKENGRNQATKYE